MTAGSIKRLRKRLRLTQSAAADLVRVSPNTWARWERGEARPRGLEQRRLLSALPELARRHRPRYRATVRLGSAAEGPHAPNEPSGLTVTVDGVSVNTIDTDAFASVLEAARYYARQAGIKSFSATLDGQPLTAASANEPLSGHSTLRIVGKNAHGRAAARPSSTGASISRFAGTWAGDDADKVLKEVYARRSKAAF